MEPVFSPFGADPEPFWQEPSDSSTNLCIPCLVKDREMSFLNLLLTFDVLNSQMLELLCVHHVS